MPQFYYEAITSAGATRTGKIEAVHAKQARTHLQDRGLWPVVIQPVAVPPAARTGTLARRGIRSLGVWWGRIRRKTHWRAAERALWAREMGMLLSAGMPLERALTFLMEAHSAWHLNRVLVGLRVRVREGLSLGTAMEAFPEAFTPVFQATVRAAEHAGLLDTMLLHMAEYTERHQQLSQQLIHLLIYPVCILVAACSMMGFLMVSVVPKMIQVFEDADIALPALTRWLVAGSHGIQTYAGWIALIGAAAVGGGMWAYRTRPAAAWAMQRALLACPGVGRVVQRVAAIRLVRTLGILLGAGVPIMSALQHAASVLPGIYLRARLTQAMESVRAGETVHRALAQMGFLTPLMLHLVATGESSGRLDTLLVQAAELEERRLYTHLGMGLRLLEPLIILGMGVGVMVVVLAILLPIFDMNDWVQL